MRICLLITTYRRNKALFRLLRQCNDLVRHYRGEHTYEICVADSDRTNPDSARIAPQCSRYTTNMGAGFDDNLLGFYREHLAGYDYVLSMSDDDLFSFSSVNPLHYVDIPVRAKSDAALFNHIAFTHSEGDGIRLGSAYYSAPALTFDGAALLNTNLQSLPRHVGLLYSVRWVLANLEALAAFRGTRHLYAVPFILAAVANKASYIDSAPFYFCNDPPSSGAWEGPAGVFDGLVQFLAALRPLVPARQFAIAKAGFMRNYLGENAWLRAHLRSLGAPDLMSEEAVLACVDGGEMVAV